MKTCLFFSFLFLVLIFKSEAQVYKDESKEPLPSMYVDSTVAEKRYQWAEKTKTILWPNGNPIRFDYEFSQWEELLTKIAGVASYTGLRIYIASASDSETDPQKNLKIIFAPTRQVRNVKYTDAGDYYIWDKNQFDVIKSTEIARIAEHKKYVKNYKQGILNKVLNKITYPSLNGSVLDSGDTRTIVYDSSKINGLRKELSIQAKKLQRIALGFTSFTGEEPNVDSKYYNRLIMQFVLFDRNGKVFLLDSSRPRAERLTPEVGLDTGDPCPPNGNCDGALLDN